MRISDWSSDVCSSDLLGQAGPDGAVNLVGERGLEVGAARAERRAGQGQAAAHYLRHVDLCLRAALERNTDVAAVVGKRSEVARHIVAADHVERSEEPTSELQSLMRNAYDVFCLKKKTQKSKNTLHIHINISNNK